MEICSTVVSLEGNIWNFWGSALKNSWLPTPKSGMNPIIDTENMVTKVPTSPPKNWGYSFSRPLRKNIKVFQEFLHFPFEAWASSEAVLIAARWLQETPDVEKSPPPSLVTWDVSKGGGFGREGLRESLYPPGKFNMEPQKLEVWNMIFPFEFDDFWASKLIFRSVSGLFNKDFQKARNFQLLDGAGFRLHPAGPWRAHFVGCHEYRLITTKASETLKNYAWVVNADGEECVLRCPPMSRLENWIPLFGYWLIFKLWVAKAAIRCPWKKGQQGKFVFVHHETSLKWWIWCCRYLSPRHHTIWCILMAWRYANAEEGPTCELQPKTSILGLKGCYPLRKRGKKTVFQLPTTSFSSFSLKFD